VGADVAGAVAGADVTVSCAMVAEYCVGRRALGGAGLALGRGVTMVVRYEAATANRGFLKIRIQHT
jgi:hypothetical protein